MATSAAPLRSVRHNLPASLTSFIGRERELAEVQTSLGEARLLTLTGVGGCGKTRLALEVARAVQDHYHDGVWLVELGPLLDPSLVPHSVAAVVGGREIAGESAIAALAARLRTRRLLLLLDNCEHLLDACARLVDALLRACPNVHVLTTSREALGITGEITWRVPSLAVPDLQRLPSLDELRRSPAIQLFTERAVASQPRFVLTERNAPAVAQVCARLDGIPLALELAAARVAALSVDQIAARLDQRFRLLTGGSRVALPRQQTLRATLDWSYELLTESERSLLNRLAVFAGGWGLEAAEAVCVGAHVGDEDVLDLVVRLVSKSLVVAEEGPDGTERYRLLETVREYAREQLVNAGEAEAVHQQHANYFLAFADAHDPDEYLRTSISILPSSSLLDRLECEHDNLRAALRWWIESQDADRALRQATTLFPIWFLHGSLTEGRAWLEEVLALPTARGAPWVKIRALPMLAALARRHGDFELALGAYTALLAAMEAAGDTRGAAQALSDLANVHYLRADFMAGWACLERSQAMAGDLRDPGLESCWRFVGGQLALHEGRYELARTLLAEELEITGRQSGSLYSGYVLMNLGTVRREQGEYAEADILLTQGLQVAERYGDNSLLPLSVAGMSALATALGQHERALRLGGAAAALRDVTGAAVTSPAWRSMFERWLAASRAALSDGATAAAWQSGQEMSLKQAVEFAQASSAQTTSDTPAAAGPEPTTIPGPLTRREIEVAALIAQGLSNRQIAERLVITSRTVASHIENILEKLAFTSRTQIAVWAMEHGLVAPSLA